MTLAHLREAIDAFALIVEESGRAEGRRTDVVVIFPNDRAVIRRHLHGHEHDDEWLVGRHYFSARSTRS